MASDYLAWALADFSGYLAADELYDGPFCVLSVVDNRRFKRLAYEVLDHDPTQADIQRFFRRFKAALNARSLTVQGITTDASPLYPGPIAKVFGNVPHQICEFHFCSSKVTELFDNRHLFVQHYLTPAERRTLARITRGHKSVCTLRKIMDEVYRLFDRRCRSETALQKLAKLRRRVSRFKTVGKTLQKLFSPNLEKALTFLNDKLLPSTSNAVERGNRRHRKMQKTIYRVRTRENISNRIALDMLRDAQAEGRNHTIHTLHLARTR